MNTPSLIVTILTVTAFGSTPAVASAATKCPDDGGCRIALNHSEALVVGGRAERRKTDGAELPGHVGARVR